MITVDMLNDIVARAERDGLGEALLVQLRAAYPGRHFTYCMDDDVHAGKPVAERRGFRIYLVSSSEHCSQITTALEQASGLVIAEVLDD